MLRISKYCLVLFFLIDALAASAQRMKYNFNSDWKVFVGDAKGAQAPGFNDASWKNVTLPYAWNEDEAFKKDIKDLSTGIAWYRKHFKLPASAKGQKVFLEFEGIRQAGDFYVNGKHVGMHENGVMAFGFDVTDLVKFGNEENVIAARIDNDWNYREKATNQNTNGRTKISMPTMAALTKMCSCILHHKVYQTLPLYSQFRTTGVYIYADNYNIKRKICHHTC